MIIDNKFLLFIPYIISNGYNIACFLSMYVILLVDIITNDSSMDEYDTADKRNQQAVIVMTLNGVGMILGSFIVGYV